jgi:hypothetical protein
MMPVRRNLKRKVEVLLVVDGLVARLDDRIRLTGL